MAQGTIPQQPDDEVQVSRARMPQEKSGTNWKQAAIWLVVAAVLVFLTVGLINAFASQPTEGAAPDFTMELYGGGEFTLSELRGQVVVINFWASWCGPCADEAPDLQQAWVDYQDQGVQFIGVDYVDSEAKGLAYIEEYGITYPNGADLGSRISDAYNIRGVPETFIINREGEIVYFAMEPLTYTKLAAQIEMALAE